MKSSTSALSVSLLVLAVALSCGRDPDSSSGPNGEYLFKANCGLCHGQNGQGGAMNLGPSYKGIRQHWDEAKLLEYIDDPKAFAAKDPRLGKREMTAVADSVSAEERRALVQHVLSLMD